MACNVRVHQREYRDHAAHDKHGLLFWRNRVDRRYRLELVNIIHRDDDGGRVSDHVLGSRQGIEKTQEETMMEREDEGTIAALLRVNRVAREVYAPIKVDRLTSMPSIVFRAGHLVGGST